MALINKPPVPVVKEQFRLRIAQEVLSEMDDYCKWQGLERDYFIEQAVLQVFKKDKEWKEYKNESRPSLDVSQN